MNASNRPLRRPIQHLESPNAEMWMGLIDGIYAIAMTLIAIELPELASQLINTIDQQVEPTTISGLLIYELIAYTATFLILYELWSFHKSILKLSGIRHTLQNLTNGLILALTCLGAGNIILILKTKTELASKEINAGMSQATILKDWINHGTATSICMLLMIANMFGLMSLLARTKANPKESSSLKALERITRTKAFLFLLFPLNWLPMLFGSQTPLAPVALVILAYIALSHVNGAKLRNRLDETFKGSS
jgi:uncharacterized membrane protein